VAPSPETREILPPVALEEAPPDTYIAPPCIGLEPPSSISDPPAKELPPTLKRIEPEDPVVTLPVDISNDPELPVFRVLPEASVKDPLKPSMPLLGVL
jgi:hypothetical protein